MINELEAIFWAPYPCKSCSAVGTASIGQDRESVCKRCFFLWHREMAQAGPIKGDKDAWR